MLGQIGFTLIFSSGPCTAVLSEDAFDTAIHAQKWFANDGPKSRRDIFMSLGSKFTLKSQKLSVELEFPFQVIEKISER